VIEPAVVVLRLIQYAGAMVLLGSSLFFVYALPARGESSAAELPWARKLLAGAGAVLAITSLLWIGAETSLLAGSMAEGLKAETLGAMVTSFDLGKAAIVRAAVAGFAALVILTVSPLRTAWLATATLGAVATASLAWLGHGAAGEGTGGLVHVVSDILHSWAAAVWLGALVAFLLLLSAPRPSLEATAALHRALHGFSGLGTVLVAVLVLTGIGNGWFLVGPDRLQGLWTTPYGRLLSLKLVLFIAMLALAAANRFRLAPALGRSLAARADPRDELAALRQSVAVEMAIGLAVLGLVAWFGTLPPPESL
jgi:putative copper resistance protein D